jgi:hypothetical protein
VVGAPRHECAELAERYVLEVVSFQIVPKLPENKLIPSDRHTLSPLLDVCLHQMLHDSEQKRLTIHCRCATPDRAMQPKKRCKEWVIGNNRTAKVRQFFSIGHRPGKTYEYSRTQTQRSVNVALFIDGFSGVGFAAVNEKDLARMCSVPRSLVCVLLDPFFHQAYNQMLVRMTREPVLHVMGVHGFARVRTAETMNSDPLFSLRHMPIILEEYLQSHVLLTRGFRLGACASTSKIAQDYDWPSPARYPGYEEC